MLSKGGANCPPLALKVETAGGSQRVLCWHTPGILRLIQSIPSPKAEPFKRWLAQVGYERLQEIENPEIAARRMKEIYRQKGYSEAWIEKRMRGIAVRDELTDEWKKRGVKEDREYAILTAEISKATFGMTPSQYREHKALERPTDNLRDHMTDPDSSSRCSAKLRRPKSPSTPTRRDFTRTKSRPSKVAASQATPAVSSKPRAVAASRPGRTSRS